jgi:lipid-A-disaccharide synthase
MKRMKYQPWVGLPNILCRDFVVPELVQGDCRPDKLAAAVLRWLDDPAAASARRSALKNSTNCCRRDTARCATDAIAQVLQA